jgi:hypothetical protein
MGLRVRAAWRTIVTMINLANIRRAFEDKIKAGIFKPVERHLHENIVEDRMQDALGLVWRIFAEHAERGEVMDDALLVHAVKLRAMDLGRRVAQCDGEQPLRDVFDLRNQLAGRVEVLRLGDFREAGEESTHRGLEEDDASLGFGLAEATCANPTARILSAHDLTAWLAGLPAEERRMLELRAAGYTLEETADELGVSLTTVFHNCRRLGLALAERTGIPIAPRTHKTRKIEAQPASSKRPRSSMADALPRKMGKASRARRSDVLPCAA